MGHVTFMGGIRNTYKVLLGKLKGMGSLGDGKRILKEIL